MKVQSQNLFACRLCSIERRSGWRDSNPQLRAPKARRLAVDVHPGPSSWSRTNLSASSAQRCHRVSCRGVSPTGFEPVPPVRKAGHLAVSVWALQSRRVESNHRRAEYETARPPRSAGTAPGAGIEPAIVRLTAACLAAWLPWKRERAVVSRPRVQGETATCSMHVVTSCPIVKERGADSVVWLKHQDSNLDRLVQSQLPCR